MLENLHQDDFEAVRVLLEQNALLACDLTPGDLRHFVGVRQNGAVVAVGGIEICGSHGLLRSIAVADSMRGQGCGKAIVLALEAHATASQLGAFYLLTQSADVFFDRLGYQRIARSAVPEAILATPQFTELCPDSAVCMTKSL